MKRLPSLYSFVLCSLLSLTASQALAADSQSKPLIVPCGKVQMVLQCVGGDCGTTSLRLESDSGRATNIHRPKGLERYTAVGLSCAKATDGTPYFVVQYGELPQGCSFCEWFHLYSTQGELLTHSDPAILTNTSAPEGPAQTPNNAEFDALDRKFGLGRPKIHFIE